MTSKSKTILIGIIIIALLAWALVIWKSHPTMMTSNVPSAVTIDPAAGNYGLFINGQDGEYFATDDVNVWNIIKTYLAGQYPNATTDAEKYGNDLVYYYTKENFIVANLIYWADLNNISSFVMYDTKTGKPISDCYIYPQAGLYKDADLLLSVSYTGESPNAKNGVCLYERGTPNFTFIDLTPQLTSTETLFNDPTGETLKASITNVDTHKKTFSVDVYDTTKKDSAGNYAYKRSIEVSY